MTPAEFLRRARARISDPKHWTQRAYGRNAAGAVCAVSDAYTFNDSHSHAEVLAAFDQAIAALDKSI